MADARLAIDEFQKTIASRQDTGISSRRRENKFEYPDITLGEPPHEIPSPSSAASVCRCVRVPAVRPSAIASRAQAIPAGSIRVHYHRPDGNYAGWTIYAFDNTTENTGNYGGGPVQVTGTDSFGAYFDVGVTTGAQEVGIIIHNPTAPGGDQKDTPNNLFVDPCHAGHRVLGILRHRQALYIRTQPDQPHGASAGIRARSLSPHGRQLRRLDDLRLLRHHGISAATTTAASCR